MSSLTFRLWICALLCSPALWGQKMPSDYFQEGIRFEETGDYRQAAHSYQYIIDHCPKNPLFPKAYFNAGYCYYLDKQLDSACQIFRSILARNFNEKDPSGGDIMDNPYANYRHQASSLLSHIYYDKAIYDSALYYFALSDTIYPYIHFCGNAYASYDIAKSIFMASIYEKMGQKNRAIEALLPSVFVNLADNEEIISKLKVLLKDTKNLKDTLDEALAHPFAKPNTNGNDNSRFYYFTFLNMDLIFPRGYEDATHIFNREEAIAEVKKTPFYEMIEGL